MARLRKSARFWRDPEARRAANCALVHGGSEPNVFQSDPTQIFGRHAALEVEIGAGRGDFILSRAASAPERNFLAVELAPSLAWLLALRCAQSGMSNLRVLRADARSLVNLLLPERSVSAFHVYFPDPWPKTRHSLNRLFRPAFVDGLKRTMAPGAVLWIATDVADYAARIEGTLRQAGFHRVAEIAPGAAVTAFGRKFQQQGRTVWQGGFELQARQEAPGEGKPDPYTAALI